MATITNDKGSRPGSIRSQALHLSDVDFEAPYLSRASPLGVDDSNPKWTLSDLDSQVPSLRRASPLGVDLSTLKWTHDDTPESPTRPGANCNPSSGMRSSNWLLDGLQTTTSNSTEPRSTYLRDASKTLRLNLLYDLGAKALGFQEPEKEKVAVHKDRRRAAIQCLIHIAPVFAAIVLVFFNIWQYYIGGELSGAVGQDTQKLAALQFAAKLHELLMLASLGVIVFHFIRQELAFGDGLPFGAIFAGQQFDKLSTLWSLEFWSVAFHAREQKQGQRRRKWGLFLLILVCILLGVSVGPSGANLMRPRLDDWPAGGTTFWINGNYNTLMPTNIDANMTPSTCLQDTGDAACPYGDYTTLMNGQHSYWPRLAAQGAMPETLYVASPYSVRAMWFRHRSVLNDSAVLWPSTNSIATAPHSAIADGLARVSLLWAYAASHADNGRHFRIRKEVTYSVEGHQPAAAARCVRHNGTIEDLPGVANTTGVLFANLSSMYNVPASEELYAHTEVGDYQEYSNAEIFAWLNQTLLTADTPSVRWIDDPDILDRTASSLLAIASFPRSVWGAPLFVSCSIGTWLMPTEFTTTRNNPKVVTGTWTDPWNSALNATMTYPSAAWAEYTNPNLPANGADAFSRMTAAAGLWNSTLQSRAYNVVYATESILASMLANGLARLSYNKSMVGTLKDINVPGDPWSGGAWVDQFLPGGKAQLGYGGNAFDLSTEQAAGATQFTMRAKVNGYAYSSKGITQKAAIVTLLIYCMMAAAHSVYIVWTGWTSSAWDTPPELTALALNSERTNAMHNTSAGVHSSNTFGSNVRFQAKDGAVQMVFNRSRVYGEPIVPGQTYS
ncbi:hypothetical protein LTR10_007675 [Elasticomyces elasticus]|nr:hypothetical protein LTR10_007675 [Elasticomyces elasticus]KAK4970675.1 hypothetical protein LTR42_007651 [Elasticomyces elasticus]